MFHLFNFYEHFTISIPTQRYDKLTYLKATFIKRNLWHIYCNFVREKLKMNMQFINVKRFSDITTDKDDKKFILIYKSGTLNSDCAYDALKQVEGGKVFIVDVNEIKNVHQHFSVNSVPSLVVFNKDKVENIIKGCHTPNYFSQIIHQKKISVSPGSSGQTQKRVIVYSTPTCQYCNKIKAYFNKHGIKFTDINVASNQQAAAEMVRKSGQRGVPQTEINGQMIIGFDTAKLSRMLNIPTE